MRRDGLIVSAWGMVLVLHSVVLFVWQGAGWSPFLLLAAGLGSVATGLVVAWRGRTPGRLVVPDVSPPAALLAVGVAVAAGALVAGTWLAWLGAGIVVIAAAGIIRETLAMRRAAGR
jgi:hypothetical protein